MTQRPADGDEPGLDLDDALGSLFEGEPDGFIAARDDLAKRLRAAGRRDDAARVKAIRRPSVAAWAVNRLVRRRRADIERLAGLGEHLRGAQAEAYSRGGGADRLRRLGADRRVLVSELAEDALQALRARGVTSESHRDDIVATLEAVAADGDAATRVLAGRLTRPLEPPVGFGTAEGVVVPLGEEGAKRRPRSSDDKGGSSGSRLHVLDAAEVRKARARATRAREGLEAAEREVARLEAALTTARQELARAREATARADAAARAAGSAATRSSNGEEHEHER